MCTWPSASPPISASSPAFSASDGAVNLTGTRKLDRLRSQFGDGAFDYIGNDTPDLPLLAHATEPMVANPSLRLRLKLRIARHSPRAHVY